MKNLIITAAGSSTRFPNMKPKWMLTHPNGNLMVTEAIRGLNLSGIDNIYLVVKKEHIQKFASINGIIDAFKNINISSKLKIVEIEDSRNQPESAYLAIKKENINGSIFIKDSDNYFEYNIMEENAVTCYNLNNLALVNPSNKSYAIKNDDDYIINIIEKKVVSPTFCCGGHSFLTSELFVIYFEKLRKYDDLYLSNIIYNMLLDGHNIKLKEVRNYEDWGTIEDWNRYKRQFKTLFVDIDGVIVENGGQYFGKIWGERDGIEKNIETLNKLHSTGKVKIILTTCRTKEFEEVTRQQLERVNLKYDDIIFNLFHGRRIIINDYCSTNPYESCKAINIKRNDNNLGELI